MRRTLVWALLATTTTFYGVELVWWFMSSPDPPSLNVVGWALFMVPASVAFGAYLMWKRPENPSGELLTVANVSTFLLPTMLELPTVMAFEQTGSQGWMWAPIWLAQTLTALGTVAMIALLVMLPEGSIRFRRERTLITWSWVLVALPTLSLISNEEILKSDLSFPGVNGVTSPFVVEALSPAGPTLGAIAMISFAVVLVAIVFLFMRYRTSPDRQRRQLRWVLYGGTVAILIAGAPYALGEIGWIPEMEHDLGGLIGSLPILLFYASVVIAVVEPSWADVDIVIRKSFVYGALSAVILVLYIAAASAFGMAAAGAQLDIQVAVVLTVVVALLFQPARRRLQVVADRWVFGARPSRYEAVTEFGETIENASDPEELLPRLVETIRSAIRFEWVAASLDDGTHAEAGVPGSATYTVPIGAGSERIGLIECGPKIGGSLDDDERHLLQTLAAQVGMAVMNARLAGRIVNAAEAERRRIERNIHDGAQQELVALVARLGMAKAKAARGDVTPEQIDELQREARHILADLRALAQGIHPSVLSDGGILEAVEETCSRLPIEVSLHAADWPRTMRFDDDVEGAAYFFVTETLANVLKHSGATSVEVRLSRVDDSISLDIRDNGHGFDPDTVGQNGLAGLSDRIRALGGTMRITSGQRTGTSVRAQIPAGQR